MKDWFCLDCRCFVELNRHGYCARCGSDGVAPPTVPTKPLAEYEVELLERMMESPE